MKKIKPRLRRNIQKYFKNRGVTTCCICGKPLNGDISIEHVIPKSAFPTNKRENLNLAHQKCNNINGTLFERVEIIHSLIASRKRGKINISNLIKVLVNPYQYVLDYLNEAEYVLDNPLFLVKGLQ